MTNTFGMGFNGNAMVVDKASGFLTPINAYAQHGFTSTQKVQLLELLREKLNVGKACKAVGVSMAHFYLCMEHDKALAKAYQEIKQAHLDDIVGSMYDRAKTPNGTLAGIFLLKTQRNAEYGDKTTIVHQSKPAENAFGTLLDVTSSSTIAQPPSSPTVELPLGEGEPTTTPSPDATTEQR